MDSSQFVSVIVARWKLAAVVLLAVVAAALALMQLMPTRYTARASMLVDTGRTTNDPGGRGLMGLEQKIFVATQVQVLASERVAQAVGRSLQPQHVAFFRQRWEQTDRELQFDEWLTKALLKTATVTSAREANVIDVTVRAPSASLAAEIANLFVKRYIDIAVDLRVQAAQQYLSFYEKQAEEQRHKLERARQALTRFNQSKGILAADPKAQDVETSRLADLSREVTILEAQLAEASGRFDEARQRGDAMKEVTTDAVVIQMRNDLQRSKTTLSQLRQTLGDAHPRVVELQQSIDDQASRLQRETARITSTVGVERSVVSQRLATLRASLREQRARVSTLESARSESALMLADVDSAQREYDSIVKNLNQMRLESRGTQGNATLLESALPPVTPSGLSAPIVLAIAVFLGTLLGVAVAAVREVFDRRIRTDAQLSVLIDQPVLVTVPSFSGRKAAALKISPRRALSGKQRRLPAA